MKLKAIPFLIVVQLLFVAQVYAQASSGFISLSVSEFNKTISSEKVVLIDVRSADEFTAGHIKNSINIDMHDPDFADKVMRLVKNKEVALYCRSGHRSKIAATALVGKIKTIYELVNGFNGWTSEGMPVDK